MLFSIYSKQQVTQFKELADAAYIVDGKENKLNKFKAYLEFEVPVLTKKYKGIKIYRQIFVL